MLRTDQKDEALKRLNKLIDKININKASNKTDKKKKPLKLQKAS